MPTFIKTGLWETSTTAQVPKGWLNLTKLISDIVNSNSDLKSLIDTKISGSGTANYIPKFSASGTIGNSLIYDNGTNVGIGTTTPSEKLDVNGNVKATQVKDQYGTLKAQRTITITGNTTLSEIHNGAILHITNSCTLTFDANLGKDFNFVEKAFGSIVVQHVAASGVTLNSDSGLILKNGAMGSVYAPSNDNFILTGTYTTS